MHKALYLHCCNLLLFISHLWINVKRLNYNWEFTDTRQPMGLLCLRFARVYRLIYECVIRANGLYEKQATKRPLR